MKNVVLSDDAEPLKGIRKRGLIFRLRKNFFLDKSGLSRKSEDGRSPKQSRFAKRDETTR